MNKYPEKKIKQNTIANYAPSLFFVIRAGDKTIHHLAKN
jgi:hypothetical protein